MTDKRATLWGIDDNGKLEVPVILLWRTKKGAWMGPENLGGAVKHGQTVEVKQVDDDGWVKVYRMVVHKGKKYPQEGWVKKSLVRFTDD